MSSAPKISDEYIDDRSIAELAQDEFRHDDVVKELAHLVEQCSGQANIALFAPWGSGKSGISNLLRSELEDKSAKKFYVHFDAFKHRDTSLRRSFLRAVAKGVDKDPQDIDDLSREEVTQELSKGSGWRILRYVAGALVVGLFLMAILSLILAWARQEAKGESFGDSFVLMFTRLSGVATLVAALIGVVVTGLLGGVGATRKRTPLSKDDEFEDAFRSLAEDANLVVVFIDELDRCAAAEVVATLETMRVFLDVKNCVFIVAADRQALEQALRLKARQETPADDVHPYFSSAGAYVDKIFQYQLALPPLRWTDAGEFAENLVKNRGGLWKELREWGELQEVLTALLPTHVTSPRRVKVLLNSYVIEHRLAKRRVGVNEMSDIKGRAAALAQLVCLRAEFPLFADELESHPDLPAAALAVSQKMDLPQRQESPLAWARAEDFINHGRPLAPLLYTPAAPEEQESPDDGGEPADEASEEGDGDG